MAVADGTMDCDSVVVCAARWSHMASGDGMVYDASEFCHGGLPVMVGWVSSLVVIADSATDTEHSRLFMPVLCVFSFLFFFCFFLCTKHALMV